MFLLKKLAKSFDGKLVFRNVDMLIKKGEKVFLLGDNGCGKTTLLNILAGRMRPTEGSYYLGSHVEEAYYEQTMTSLDPEATVLREVWDRYYTTISHKDICNALAAFLFRGDEIEKQIKLLSGGEAARVQLLKLMLTKANLLLLDEPTNHLDIASREALEAALEGYNGTMLIVTHDRYLVNRLADRILHMTPSGLRRTSAGMTTILQPLTKAAHRRTSKSALNPAMRWITANANSSRAFSTAQRERPHAARLPFQRPRRNLTKLMKSLQSPISLQITKRLANFPKKLPKKGSRLMNFIRSGKRQKNVLPN